MNIRFDLRKQPPRGVLRKSCSENMQSNLTEITFRHGCAPVNLLHISRTPFIKKISECLLLGLFVSGVNQVE